MVKVLITSFLITLNIFCEAQKIKILTTHNKISLRGLSVVNDKVLWVSGSKGTVGLSLNGGDTFKWVTVKGFDSTDFRDIEAFSSTEAIIMGIGEPAYILKTKDAGESWKIVYENKSKGIFLDAMEFWNPQSGIVIGDPIDGKFVFARTFDEGNTWQNLPSKNLPIAATGEACFASSGTNIRSYGKDQAIFVSGGLQSHIFIKDAIIKLPIIQGTESTGANSIAINKNKRNIIIVGGDFNAKNDTTNNCVLSSNGCKTFTKPAVPPNGYRSCVEYYGKSNAITCGLNGVDITNNNGTDWTNISTESFHVCRKAKDGKKVYLAGGGGKVGVFINN